MKTVIKTIAILLVVTVLGSAILSLVGGVHLKIINPWLDEAKASNVDKIEIFGYSYNEFHPNWQVECFYTTDKEIIADAVNFYGSIKVSPVWDLTNMNLYLGAFAKDVVFTYADGSEKDIGFDNGYYDFGLFLLNSGSSDFDVEGMNSFYRFMVNDESYRIYTATENKKLVKEVKSGASELGFEIYEGEADKSAATHIIETSFGSIYVITDKICYLDIKLEDFTSGDGYYTIYDTTFTEMIK